MRILNRYIRNNLLSAILLVLLLLLVIETFIEFLSEMRDIGKGHYGLLQALVYVPLQLPTDLFQLFPVAGLIGSLLGLSRLANSSELLVIRSVGVSGIRIMWIVIKSTFGLVLLVSLIGMTVAPLVQRYADNYKEMAKSGRNLFADAHGIWMKDGRDFFHIDTVTKEGQLRGITRFQFQGSQLTLTSYAKSGRETGNKWEFNDISQTHLLPNRIKAAHIKTQMWPVHLNPTLLLLSSFNPAQLTINELYHYIRMINGAGIQATNYRFIFWQSLLSPLAMMLMICLGIPFIFGALRNTSTGVRIVIGIVVGFCFYTINQFFGPVAIVYQVSPFIAALMPIVLFAIIGLVLIFRSGLRR